MCGLIYALVAAIGRLTPFPDVVAALERLARRYRLVVLSNGVPDMLEAARSHIGFAFERMILDRWLLANVSTAHYLAGTWKNETLLGMEGH